MSSATVTSATISALEDAGPGEALPVQEIVDRVTARLEQRERTPKANEIRGRLTRLLKEGIVEKPERGHYALVRTDQPETARLSQLADVIEQVVRPDQLGRMVLWDATPYLELSEDGGPGTRLVVEHDQASALSQEVEVAWATDESLITWTSKTTGPLGTLLWEPDEPAPYRIPLGILFVDREKLGATGLTKRGYRAPFPERVMMEFVGLEGPGEATPIVQSILDDPDTDFRRLWQAAENLGTVIDLSVLMAGRLDELQPKFRNRFLEGASPVVRTLIEGRR